MCGKRQTGVEDMGGTRTREKYEKRISLLHQYNIKYTLFHKTNFCAIFKRILHGDITHCCMISISFCNSFNFVDFVLVNYFYIINVYWKVKSMIYNNPQNNDRSFYR